MAQIDSLSLKITASSADASRKLKELSDALKVFRSSSNITTATNNLSKLSTALTSLNRLRVMPEKYRQIGDGVQYINNAVSQISLASVNRVERLANALEKLGQVKGINSSVRKALGSLAIPAEEAQNSEEIEKKTENAGAAANKAVSSFTRLKETLRGIARSSAIAGLNSLKINFDGLRNAIHRALSPLRRFLSSIGRIAMYRAIRSAIKSVATGVKEGLQNLAMFSYQMKELDTHKANRVLSLYTSNFLYLKNAIATAVIPVLRSLEPIIDTIINKMVDFINIIAQLGSFLSGATTYTKAKYYYKDYAESLDKASGSAAKLNKQLAKFDEINNITFKDGSGSGSNLDDYLQMFEDPVPIAEWIKNLRDKDWYEIGKTIADKFSNALENINWDKVKSKAANVASKFASFLNGVFTPRTFTSVAKTIAESLNTALTSLKSFGETINTRQLGNGIIKGITTFFETFDFGLLADTLNVFKDRFFDFVKGIFDGLKDSDWKKIFSNMFEFFKKIEPDTVGVVLGAILITKGSKFLITYGAGFIEGIAKQIGQKLATTEIAASLGNVVLTAATCLITVAAVAITAEKISTHALGYDPFDPDGLGAGKDNRKWTTNPKRVYNNTGSRAGMPSNVVGNKAIPDRLKNNEKKSAELTASGYWTWVQNLEDDGAIGKVMANVMKLSVAYGSWAKDIITSTKKLKIEWKTFWDEYTTKITNFCIKNTNRIEKFKKQWEAFWFDIFDFWSDPIGKSGLETALENLYTNGKKVIGNIKDLFKQLITYFTGNTTKGKSTVGMPDEIKKSLGLDKEKSFIDDVKNIGANIVKGIIKAMTDESGKISLKALFDNFVKGLKKIFDIHSPSDKKEIKDIGKDIVLGVIKGFDLVDFNAEMTNWWNTNVKPWFTVERWLGIANNIKTAISTKWNETKTQWQTNLTDWWTNNVAPWFTLEKWKGVADGIRAGIVAKWNEIKLWWQGAVSGIVEKAKSILNYDSFYSIGSTIGKGLKSAFNVYIGEMKALWNGLKSLVAGGLSMNITVGVNDNGFNSALENWQSKVNGLIGSISQLNLGDVQPTDLGGSPDPHNPKGGGTVNTTTTGNGLKSGNVNLASGFRDASDSVKEAAAKASLPEDVRKKIYGYATGGFPKVGSLFVAHERGPELVGSFDGKTGVANQDQITEAMFDATYKAMSKALSENSTTGRIEVDENAFFRFVQQKASEYFMSTGNSPFPV